jgi:deoxyribodipyrimidine photolyase-related protein
MLEPDMYNDNFLKAHKKVDERYWLGTTNIKPIDAIIKNIVKYSYAHHIERLMYLGNWFLINKIDPKEVYNIFMQWSIDSYDWVMIGNVFGMSQFASNTMMTKPYFSSSNYILKMSDFKKGEWCIKWDAQYYNFINTHIKLLEKNYGTAIQVKHWKNKTKKEKDEILSNI